MRRAAQRFLDRWSKAPRGTSAAAILRSLGLSRYFAQNEMRRDDKFKRRYQAVQEHHRRRRPQTPRLSSAELGQRLERFLELLQEQADRRQPFNQLGAAREAGVPSSTLWSKRNSRCPGYDRDFTERWMSIVGNAIIAAEDHATNLATRSASELIEEGEDPRQLTALVKYLRCAPGSVFREQRHVKIAGRLDHQHHHRGITEAVAAVQGRFLPLGALPAEGHPQDVDLDALYDRGIDEAPPAD